MWLLNTKTLQLREFSGELPGWRPGRRPGKIPHYAILSHCWREGEVLFQDIQDLDRARRMPGFTKIERCCEQALKIGYKWAWVDTCCINKSSSAELSEAINSMFKWYGHAGTCLVYLDDVDRGDSHRPDSLFQKSRWFTRGWTLQELLAPKRLVFFSQSWSFLGTKGSLLALLGAITKIPVDALSDNSSLSSFSIAQRMSWAANRQTTRLEDQAYSLMGLFDIFMPIIYGEGSAAFRRLQLEIIQRSSDQTIFAWPLQWSISPSYSLHFFSSAIRVEDDDHSGSFLNLPSHFCINYSSILAPSPADFKGSGGIVPLPMPARNQSPDEPPEMTTEYSWTHLGLHIHMSLIPVRIHTKHDRPFIGMLSCWNPEEQSVYGIMLFRKNVQDPYRCYDLGVRGSGVSDSTNHLVSISKKDFDEVFPKLALPRDIYITNQPDPGNDRVSNSAIGRDSPAFIDHGSNHARLLIVFPDFALNGLKEMGFSLAGHASRRGPESPQDMEFRRDPGGDVLLEFQLLPHGTDMSYSYSNCFSTHANLLFRNRYTNQAFSIFIGHSRHSLLGLGSFHPRVSIDVAFHHSEEFATLEASTICDKYDHHHYHKHFRIPSDVRVYDEDIDDSWVQFKCDDTVDRPGLIRHCECECNQYREATTTKNFGNHKRGLSVTTTVWKEHDVEEDFTYCTVWVELSLLGRIYGGPEVCDEMDARSDIAERGSDCSSSNGEAEDDSEDDSLPALCRGFSACNAGTSVHTSSKGDGVGQEK